MQQTTYVTASADVTTDEKLAAIANALRNLDQQTAALRVQIAELDEAGICTGVVYWRRENGKPDRMYANHGINETCPLHGRPKPDKRLRTYVGPNPERQARIQAAMKRRREKLDLESAIRQTEIQRDRIERAITNAYYAASNQQRWEW